MNRFLLTLAAVPVMLAATPASAQTRAGMWSDSGISNRIARLGIRIDAGIRSNELSRAETRKLRADYRALQRLHWRYRASGLTRSERDVLRDRVRGLRREIRIADRGSWDRYERYAYDDDRYTGRGGPIGDEDDDGVCNRDGGIGGLLERIIDRDDDCLRVGDYAQGNLYGVPRHLRSRYRDTGYVLFRTNGDNVLEIDRRTNRVIDIHPM